MELGSGAPWQLHAAGGGYFQIIVKCQKFKDLSIYSKQTCDPLLHHATLHKEKVYKQ